MGKVKGQKIGVNTALCTNVVGGESSSITLKTQACSAWLFCITGLTLLETASHQNMGS